MGFFAGLGGAVPVFRVVRVEGGGAVPVFGGGEEFFLVPFRPGPQVIVAGIFPGGVADGPVQGEFRIFVFLRVYRALAK